MTVSPAARPGPGRRQHRVLAADLRRRPVAIEAVQRRWHPAAVTGWVRQAAAGRQPPPQPAQPAGANSNQQHRTERRALLLQNRAFHRPGARSSAV